MTEEREPGLSRRQVIKRGAVVGGLAWTAPVIVQSLTVPAGAGLSPPPGNGNGSTTTTTNQQVGSSGASPTPIAAQPDVTG